MSKARLHITVFLMLCFLSSWAQFSISGIVADDQGTAIAYTDIYEVNTKTLVTSGLDGRYQITDLKSGLYRIIVQSFEYNTDTFDIQIDQTNIIFDISLNPLSNQLSEVEIRARKKALFGLKKLNAVEGTAIYEGKKSEVVLLEQIVGNMAANNPRQIYAQVAGLNIYENSDAGLQLNIGGRGLDPNRTANFNTRQNGYDISADVLGYPESYYTPPAEALSEIQVVRGAASLQYGTQFGGLINFKLKKPRPNQKFSLGLRQSVGSFGLRTSFVESNGQVGKLGYYTYYNYKKGNGYRPNSGFHSHNAYSYFKYQIRKSTSISVEASYLNYLSQQAGGLTDSHFEEDQRQSNRVRNWFEVDWLLYKAGVEHDFSNSTTLSIDLFGLNAERNAVGFRGNPENLNSNPITDIDEQLSEGVYTNPRDLIKGNFDNWGSEIRLLHKYQIGDNKAIALIGAKYYKARNTSQQGAGSRGIDPNFTLQNESFPDYPNQSSFTFPNKNLSLFGEHIFRLNEKFSLTPGFRLEQITTESQGMYRRVIFDNAGNPISNQELSDNRALKRSFFLLGLGTSYKMSDDLEIYGNISQNYRSITFSDIRTVSPTFIIDPDISDEKGFTADIGVRGHINSQLNYDVGLFTIVYDNRIGIVLDDRANRIRTNIGSATIYGLESYIEWNIIKSINKNITDHRISLFTNVAITGSEYTDSEAANIEGKKVEFIPLLNTKIGMKLGFKNLLSSLQFTYLSQQFTDAENSAVAQSGDKREGIVGEIPAYDIFDWSVTYVYKNININTGINNLLNKQYFTRRATGYPGPGIIPSDGRSYYLSLGYRL